VLRLQAGHAVTPKTMQTPLLLAIVNRGASACTLDGYPRIELRGAAGAPYPFSYRHAGDQEVTSRAPGVVTLRAGAAAWVLINKNACVLNDHGRVARRLDLDPPGRADGNAHHGNYRSGSAWSRHDSFHADDTRGRVLTDRQCIGRRGAG
jgi:hypothetical protein